MKLMRVQDAVGQVLCHDITQIIPGVTKDAVFRKGHIIREEDIPVLLSVGKDTSISGKTTRICFTRTTLPISCARSARESTCALPRPRKAKSS